jgi:hypothetical protein
MTYRETTELPEKQYFFWHYNPYFLEYKNLDMHFSVIPFALFLGPRAELNGLIEIMD